MSNQVSINDRHWLYDTHFNDPTLSDLTLKLSDGTTVYAHRVVLCRRSRYFTKLITGGFRETGLKEISLHDNEPSAVLAMLRFIYGLPYESDGALWHDGKTMLPHAQVYAVAEKYELENLKSLVHKNMFDIIQSGGDKPDLIETIREIINKTPESDTKARTLMVNICVDRLAQLSLQPEFITLLEESGKLGAAVIATQKSLLRDSVHPSPKSEK